MHLDGIKGQNLQPISLIFHILFITFYLMIRLIKAFLDKG